MNSSEEGNLLLKIELLNSLRCLPIGLKNIFKNKLRLKTYIV